MIVCKKHKRLVCRECYRPGGVWLTGDENQYCLTIEQREAAQRIKACKQHGVKNCVACDMKRVNELEKLREREEARYRQGVDFKANLSIRGDILNEARELTQGDRNKAYGPPGPEYVRLGAMITAYLSDKLKDGAAVDAVDAAQIMVLLKMNRSKMRGRRDTYVDQAAYSAIAGEIDDDGQETPSE